MAPGNSKVFGVGNPATTIRGRLCMIGSKGRSMDRLDWLGLRQSLGYAALMCAKSEEHGCPAFA